MIWCLATKVCTKAVASCNAQPCEELGLYRDGEYDFEFLQGLVPEELGSISPQLICKYHAHTERIMDAYCGDIVYVSQEYEKLVHTKYKSHQCVSTSVDFE